MSRQLCAASLLLSTLAAEGEELSATTQARHRTQIRISSEKAKLFQSISQTVGSRLASQLLSQLQMGADHSHYNKYQKEIEAKMTAHQNLENVRLCDACFDACSMCSTVNILSQVCQRAKEVLEFSCRRCCNFVRAVENNVQCVKIGSSTVSDLIPSTIEQLPVQYRMCFGEKSTGEHYYLRAEDCHL